MNLQGLVFWREAAPATLSSEWDPARVWATRPDEPVAGLGHQLFIVTRNDHSRARELVGPETKEHAHEGDYKDIFASTVMSAGVILSSLARSHVGAPGTRRGMAAPTPTLCFSSDPVSPSFLDRIAPIRRQTTGARFRAAARTGVSPLPAR